MWAINKHTTVKTNSSRPNSNLSIALHTDHKQLGVEERQRETKSRIQVALEQTANHGTFAQVIFTDDI